MNNHRGIIMGISLHAKAMETQSIPTMKNSCWYKSQDENIHNGTFPVTITGCFRGKALQNPQIKKRIHLGKTGALQNYSLAAFKEVNLQGFKRN
jgi:hypothetical protein